MHNDFKTRIEIISRQTGESLEGLSVRAGLDRSYLRKVMERNDPQPRRTTLQRMAKAWNVSFDWLADGNGQIDESNDEPLPFRASEEDDTRIAGKQISILGTTDERYSIGTRPSGQSRVGSIPVIPPALSGISGIYALYVGDRSMEPQFFPGDLIFVNPSRPPRIGECTVIITETERGTERKLGLLSDEGPDSITLIKRFAAHSEDLLLIIPKDSVRGRHKVLTINELFGA